MPPEIQAAYDAGHTVTYSGKRQRWELYEPGDVKDLSPEALDLIERHFFGTIEKRIAKRLDEISANPPEDTHERLEVAARYVARKRAKDRATPQRVRIININTANKDEQASAHYIGRENKRHNLHGSALANPFKGDRATSIAKYRDWLPNQLEEDPTAAQEFSSLLGTLMQEGGVTLACWCAPEACHANVIKELLETQMLEAAP
jgi:hypothetical protein